MPVFNVASIAARLEEARRRLEAQQSPTRHPDTADARENACAGEELSRLRSLSRLQQLQLRGCFRVTDAGLRSVGALVSLTSLDCQECWQTTAAGLAGLSGADLCTGT